MLALVGKVLLCQITVVDIILLLSGPILTIPDVTFINLQYKDFADDLARVKDEFGVTVHNFEDLDQYGNVDDVAALSAALDMVVSTKVTPPIITSGVGTLTKIANWRQSTFNNILTNPVSSTLKRCLIKTQKSHGMECLI